MGSAFPVEVSLLSKQMSDWRAVSLEYTDVKFLY